jgi:uncharacterized SAM-binding protein YcdF (DUF218 family)
VLLVAVLAGLFHTSLLTAVASNLVEEDALRPSDAIIVLAGNSSTRATHGVDLLHAGWAPRLLISNERVETHGLSTTWLDLYQKGVARLDIPADAVETLPGLSESTYEEAQRSRDYLLAHGWKRAILVTDPYHTHRAALIFRKAFGPAGLEVRVSPARNATDLLNAWWTKPDGVQVVLTEYVKYANGAISGQI